MYTYAYCIKTHGHRAKAISHLRVEVHAGSVAASSVSTLLLKMPRPWNNNACFQRTRLASPESKITNKLVLRNSPHLWFWHHKQNVSVMQTVVMREERRNKLSVWTDAHKSNCFQRASLYISSCNYLFEKVGVSAV